MNILKTIQKKLRIPYATSEYVRMLPQPTSSGQGNPKTSGPSLTKFSRRPKSSRDNSNPLPDAWFRIFLSLNNKKQQERGVAMGLFRATSKNPKGLHIMVGAGLPGSTNVYHIIRRGYWEGKTKEWGVVESIHGPRVVERLCYKPYGVDNRTLHLFDLEHDPPLRDINGGVIRTVPVMPLFAPVEGGEWYVLMSETAPV